MSMQRIINYGSFLQAYGLKKMIESVSKSEVEFIDYRFGVDITNRLKKPQSKAESIVDKILKNRTPWNYLKKKNFFKEIERNLILDLKNIGVDKLNYDCEVDTLVIGSDEVFNCTQKTWFGFSSQLFGKGLNASRIITYAASFGATTIDKLQLVGKKEIVSSLLHDLDAISVRDENSMKVIEELTGRTPWLHVDPVLIFDYNQFIPDKFNRNEYIIVYTYPGRITDKKEISSIRNFAKSKELKLISIGHYFSWCDEVVIPTPFEVLAYFKGASYIITDTFHGSVFSMKFNKEFCTIVRDMNSNKLVSLLKQFGLENRIVTDMNKMQKILETPIDYAGVNKIIMEETKRSITYLTQNIR